MATDNSKLDQECKDIMALVYKRGFNIYMLLNKVKKELKRVVNFPPEVIISVCKEFISTSDKSKVRNNYTWFVRVMIAKTTEYQANQNILEHQSYKKSPPIAQNIKDVLKGMFQ